MGSDAVMTTREALDWVRRAPTLLAGLERMDALLSAARCDGPLTAALLASAVADPADQLTAIAALHAAAVADTDTASTVVVPLLDSTVPFLREHAAWALASSPRLPMAISGLSGIAAAGGFTGTLAEATLEAWGELPLDEDESPRSHRTDGQHDPVARDCRSAPRLTVAQLFLHADIDGRLLHAGQGDTGGIATLLVHLGDALLAEGTVDRVLTLSRGRPGEARIPADLAERGHHYLSVPLPGPILHAPDAWPLRLPARRGLRSLLRAAGRVDVLHLRMADVGSWAAADVAREFGIHTVLTLAPDPHALIAAREASGTLTRGNFGAADHAEHLVFRVRLLRELAEQAAHLVVFPRPNLRRDVRDLLHLDPLHLDPDSAHLNDADLDDAEPCGVAPGKTVPDSAVPGRARRRITIVPEGIDLGPLERAGREVPGALDGTPVSAATIDALVALDAMLAALPAERRGLPLAISVGRLHRIKGMATLVQAWASDPVLAGRCNLLIVGGDLQHPTDDETEQLARIDAEVPRAEGPRCGLLLAGHRPNGMVAVWLAAVRHGRPGLCSSGGIYVSASLKEEFGIAILEAMASGLVVVAPIEGGPATYVEDRVTGVLVDTHSPTALGGAVAYALDLAAAPDAAVRADRARRLVTERYSIATMASALAAVYSEVAHDVARHQS